MWCKVSHFVKIHMLRLRASDLGIGDCKHDYWRYHSYFCVHLQKHAYFADGTALSRALQWVTVHNVWFHLNKCVTNFGHQKSSHVSFWQLCYLDFNLGRHMDWTSAWSVVVIRANKTIYMYIQSFYFLMSWILWSAIHDVILQKSVIKQSWGRLKSDQLLGFFWPLVSQPVGELVCWHGLNCLKTFRYPRGH